MSAHPVAASSICKMGQRNRQYPCGGYRRFAKSSGRDMGIVQTVPCPACRYSIAVRSADQPLFFVFSARSGRSFLRFSKGRKPRLSACPYSAGDGVRATNAQPAPATGLFKGFGTLSQQAKTGFRRSRRKPVLSLCGNKGTACQVALGNNFYQSQSNFLNVIFCIILS